MTRVEITKLAVELDANTDTLEKMIEQLSLMNAKSDNPYNMSDIVQLVSQLIKNHDSMITAISKMK
jgi:hypothetical protein|tara:strand:- start:295 stop:492 length:198 start_codon:yes stop_codon:yes gene_type:complete